MSAPRIRARRHERPAADVAAHEPFRLELTIRAHNGRPAHVQRPCKVALRRELRARRERPHGKTALEVLDQPAIHRPDPRERLGIQADPFEQSNVFLDLFSSLFSRQHTVHCSG